MAKHTIELNDEQEELLGRAASHLHMKPNGAVLAIVATALMVSRNREIDAVLRSQRLKPKERLALLEEAEAINDATGMGVLPLDHPDRLPLPLQADAVPPVLEPKKKSK
jgi:hypothetical protein